ncbi:MAG: endonuclease III [Candidatus Altiarchaeota archaeon]
MRTIRKAEKILEILSKDYKNATTELKYKNPLELLVATILSAQCTDERVNKVTSELFKKYKTAEDYANAKQEIFENEIRSTGFYKNKAKNIISMARILVEKFNSQVPDTMEDLQKLPGVARKTANIVLTYGFGKVEGIAVDTHVSRVSQRLGLTNEKNPEKIEQDLMKIFPKNSWAKINSLLVLHGRYICKAKNPLCKDCKLNKICKSAFNF